MNATWRPMCPPDLSSLKWGDDGELSSQDTWNLVKRLTKVEEETKASDLLHLSSLKALTREAKEESPRDTTQPESCLARTFLIKVHAALRGRVPPLFCAYSSSSEPPTGIRRIDFLPNLISNSMPGSRPSMAVYALPISRLEFP